jgi:hypothetical protein
MSEVDIRGQRSPRSALRYRPVSDKGRIDTQTSARQSPRRAHPVASDVADDWEQDVDDEMLTALPVPARSRRVTTIAPGSVSTSPGKGPAQSRRRFHPLVWLGASVLAILLIWVGVSQALNWGNDALNTLRYGYPRTFQIDAVVGHNDSASSPSHFLALNLHGQIEIIEWPGGDSTHARVYLGPQLFGPGSDQEPVTLRFVDLNGDHLPDMVIEVQGSQIVWLNDQGGFRPLHPNEQNQIMQRLRQLGD